MIPHGLVEFCVLLFVLEKEVYVQNIDNSYVRKIHKKCDEVKGMYRKKTIDRNN